MKKRKNRRKLKYNRIFITLFILVMIIIGIKYFFFNNNIVIYDNTISFNYDEKIDFSKLKTNTKELSYKIIVGNIDNTKVGKYDILLEASKKKKSINKKISVNITDNKPPVINKKTNIDTIKIYNKEVFDYHNYFDVTDEIDKNVNVQLINFNTSIDTKQTVTMKATDKSNNESTLEFNIIVDRSMTIIDGILIVNKTYGLDKDYNPGVNKDVVDAFNKMKADALKEKHNINIVSMFRSYDYQANLYKNYVLKDGQEVADKYCAKPGHSEHQTGLAIDISDSTAFTKFGETKAFLWVKDNAYKYGFILRYPEGKEDITGYMYEPWHYRYVGVEEALKIYKSELTLEEYLGV